VPKSEGTLPADLVGTWKAPAGGGGAIELAIADANRFKWTFTRPGKTQSFEGKYSLAGTMVGKSNQTGQAASCSKWSADPKAIPDSSSASKQVWIVGSGSVRATAPMPW
jgi:hypothetical protein